ncbi:MAG: DUF4058 family protein [Anaerolineae bacterium]
MAVNAVKNEYAGVNAHLQSHMQAQHDWSGFHLAHMSALVSVIEPRLPNGCLVDIVLSMQIVERHPDTGEPLVVEEAPHDVRLYHCAVEILRVDYSRPYRPVLRIEALTPNNKRGNGHSTYVMQRHEALKKGICLVELDYMHETPALVKGVPAYPAPPSDVPYRITETSLSGSKEVSRVMPFAVDAPIPSKAFDLPGDDKIHIDFAAAYAHAFADLNAYHYQADYTRVPEHFETYSAADQARIRAVMARAVAARESH